MGNARHGPGKAWALARRQHGVVSRAQLLELGLDRDAVQHRIASGRLHPITRGVYAVGRPQLDRQGVWMAAMLACGPSAALSHHSAAALWDIGPLNYGPTHVSVPLHVVRRRPGVELHRRVLAPDEVTGRGALSVTSPTRTLVDLALVLSRDRLERAINEADKRDLVDPESLRAALGPLAGRPGVGVLRATLDRRTLTMTRSELERRFLPIARRACLPMPVTGAELNGFEVDFHWPGLRLVVETDGLRYHRTPAQQARDRLRDQAHLAAGMTPLRFTHAQVAFEAAYVEATLRQVVRRLGRR